MGVGGGKTAEQCAALFQKHIGFLSLNKKWRNVKAFCAMVSDEVPNEDEVRVPTHSPWLSLASPWKLASWLWCDQEPKPDLPPCFCQALK